jgi:ATP-dependent DNA ligase
LGGAPNFLACHIPGCGRTADYWPLLKAADRFGVEGIVSKRRDAPYRSGKQCGWVKVKCATWREANEEQWRLFERHR